MVPSIRGHFPTETTRMQPGVSAINAASLAHHSSAVSASLKSCFAGIFFDITKAYDRVHTGILFQKLSTNPKISPWLLRWIHILSDNADEDLETTFRCALSAVTGLPPKCSNSALSLQQRFSPFSTFVLLLATEGFVGSWLYLVHTPSQVGSGHGFTRIQRIQPSRRYFPPLHSSVTLLPPLSRDC